MKSSCTCGVKGCRVSDAEDSDANYHFLFLFLSLFLLLLFFFVGKEKSLWVGGVFIYLFIEMLLVEFESLGMMSHCWRDLDFVHITATKLVILTFFIL